MQVFKAHKTLLEYASPDFKTALQECWYKDGDIIELPNHSPTGFKIFLVWCYRGHLPANFNIVADGVFKQDFLEAYKTGHFLQMHTLLDLLMSEFLSCLDKVGLVAGVQVLHRVYDLDLEGTNLFDFLLKAATYAFVKFSPRYGQQGDRSEDMDKVTERPGLARLFLDRICLYNQTPWTLTDIKSNHCQWHEHLNTEQCPIQWKDEHPETEQCPVQRRDEHPATEQRPVPWGRRRRYGPK